MLVILYADGKLSSLSMFFFGLPRRGCRIKPSQHRFSLFCGEFFDTFLLLAPREVNMSDRRW